MVPHDQLLALLLKNLADVFAKSGGSIADYDLPQTNNIPDHIVGNRILDEELDVDCDALASHANALIPKLNSEQRKVFDTIVDCVNDGRPGFFFIYGHGGTDKTFLWNTIISKIRSEKKSFWRWHHQEWLLCCSHEDEQHTRGLRYQLKSVKPAYVAFEEAPCLLT